MKYKFKAVLLSMLLVVPVVFVSAETGTVKGQPVREKIQDLKQEIKEVRAEKAASTTARIERRDERREMLLKIAGIKLQNMIDRFEATIAREATITSKIISRIEKVKSAGGNTSEAEKFVSEAQKHFDEAKTSLVTLKNATSSAATLLTDPSVATSTIVKTGLKKIKDMAQTVEMHIKEGHMNLNKAVKSLRGMSSANASTTPNSN